MTTIRTKVTQLLDAHGIPYRPLPHTVPVFTIETVALQRGVVKEEMVKSILLRESKSGRAEDLIRLSGATIGKITEEF